MPNRTRKAIPIRFKLIPLAVASCFSAGAAFANPTGLTIVNGNANVVQNGNLLQITNSPSAILNWQRFSIGAGEVTRFIQQSPSSAVLNRVISQDPSAILGTLQSNGRVFLINPNGILFGSGATVDVAGLVASTLQLSNEDFLAGRMRFTGGSGAGTVVNEGFISTPSGGSVYLIGSGVTNSGFITSPQGEVILAAGQSVELVDPGTPNLRVEIVAPDNQAVNLGQIVADAGRIGIYAGLIHQGGFVGADTAVDTGDGRIILKATRTTTLAPGSFTTAVGPDAGSGAIEIDTGDLLVSGHTISGTQKINATGDITVAAGGAGNALVSATGSQVINAGGALTVQGAATGTDGFAHLVANGDQTINASSIALIGGGGESNFAEILRTGGAGSQSIEASSLAITGGTGGANNFARIRNDGTGAQTIDVSGPLSLTGGTEGALDQGNFAQIRATGPQVITAGPTTLTAGVSGFSNFVSIQGPDQDITVHGDLTLSGGGSVSGATSAGAARIGGMAGATAGPTDLTLTVDGNVTMNGGSEVNSGAIIGSNFAGGQTTDITMDVTGNVTLNTGTVTNSSARIGSPSTSIADGEISITAGGAITLAGSAVPGTRSIIRTLGGVTLDADTINVGGSVLSGAQSITAAGDITVAAGDVVNALVSATGPQTITAGGALTVQGGAGTGLSASITGSAGQTINASSIAVTGGNVGNSSFAEIFQTGAAESQSIEASSIAVTGGASGTNNFARILNNGTGAQTIVTAGDATITGGGGGADNFAVFQGRTQAITIQGDLTLNGGGSSGGGARIGGVGGVTPTNLVLNVDGDVTLNGGSVSGSSIGANRSGGQRTDIVMTVGGDVTLDSSLGGNTRIGSPAVNVAGGDISITSTGGSIVLNKAGAGLDTSIRTLGNVTLSANGSIMESADSVIQAQALGVAADGDIRLIGPNQVSTFNASSLTGDMAFNNTSPLLAVTGISQAPGAALALSQAGDLVFTGNVFSGTQAIGAGGSIVVDGAQLRGTNIALAGGGDIVVAPSSTAVSSSVVRASGDVTLTTPGAVIVRGSDAAADMRGRIRADGAVNIEAASVSLIGGDADGARATIRGGSVNANVANDFTLAGGGGVRSTATLRGEAVNLSAGNNFALAGGSGQGARAKVMGQTVAISTGNDLTLAGGGGSNAQALLFSNSGFDLGVGGTLRIDAGSGENAWARIETAQRDGVINVYFPNLSSGGYFVNGVEGRVRQGQTGFFAGDKPAKLGTTLVTTYGE